MEARKLRSPETLQKISKPNESSLVKIKRTLSIVFVIFSVVLTAVKGLQALKRQSL